MREGRKGAGHAIKMENKTQGTRATKKFGNNGRKQIQRNTWRRVLFKSSPDNKEKGNEQFNGCHRKQKVISIMKTVEIYKKCEEYAQIHKRPIIIFKTGNQTSV